MILKDKIELALKQGRVQGAKKLLDALYKQEDKQAWDEAKRAEYEAIFPSYRTMTKAEKDVIYKKYVAKCKADGVLTNNIVLFADYKFEQVEIKYITIKTVTDPNGNTTKKEVRTPTNYLTYSEWINETKVVTPEVLEVSHLDANGMKIIDTPYQAEVTKEVRPYTPLNVTAQMLDTRLATFSEYKAMRKNTVNETIAKSTVITASGKEFDANMEARQNLADAILANGYIKATQTTWRLSDNSTVSVTIAELKEAHLLALQQYAINKGIQ